MLKDYEVLMCPIVALIMLSQGAVAGEGGAKEPP